MNVLNHEIYSFVKLQVFDGVKIYFDMEFTNLIVQIYIGIAMVFLATLTKNYI
jgi:hypothetical protein